MARGTKKERRVCLLNQKTGRSRTVTVRDAPLTDRCYKGLTKAQKECLDEMNVQQLKEALKLNDCIYSGMRKEELKRSVAINARKGCLGRCPVCFGGRLRRGKHGVVYCPGSYDDTEFVPCSYVATTKDITVVPWKTQPGKAI